MSHYITASINEKEIELSAGYSRRTINAISETGFDIYDMYNAFECNGGSSGTGTEKEINFKTAENAYLNAVAWAISLEKSFSEAYKQYINEDRYYAEEIKKYISINDFKESSLSELINDISEYQADSDNDTIERSLDLLLNILKFTYEIYSGLKNGNQAIIYFG